MSEEAAAGPDIDGARGRRDEHLSRVARGSAINLAGAGFAAVGGFGLVVIITRLLDTHTSGEYFSATSAFLIVVGVTLLGVDAGLSRFVLRYTALGRSADVPLALRTARRPVVALSLVAMVVCVAAADPLAGAIGLSPDDGPDALRALGLFLPVAALSEVSLSATRAFGTMHITVFADRLLRTALQALGVLAVAAAGLGLTWVVVAWATPYLVTSAIGVVTLRSAVRHRDLGEPDPARAAPVRREFWAFTWPRSIAQVVQIIIQRIDIVLVAALIGAPEAAAYTAATRFVPLGQFIGRAIQQALQPRMSEMLATDAHDEAQHVLRQSTAWGVLATWPFYIGVVALAPTYLKVFGHGYDTADGRLVVLVMAAGMMVGAGVGALDTVLLMSGRSSLSLSNSSVALVLDLGLCLLLIPRWGIVGAAAAWSIAVAVRGAMGLWQVRRALSMSPFGSEWAWASLAIAGCQIAPVAVAVALEAHPLVITAVGVAGFLVAAFVVRKPLQLGLLGRALRGRRR